MRYLLLIAIFVLSVGVLLPPLQAAQSPVLPIGSTAVYKGDGNIWVAARINANTITFLRWAYGGSKSLMRGGTLWRSHSDVGTITSEASTEITYDPVHLYAQGVHADPFGAREEPYTVWLTSGGLSVSSKSRPAKTLVASRIGYGSFPAFYSRQFCKRHELCTGGTGVGWPLEGYFLKKLNAADSATMLIGPTDGGYETLQGKYIPSQNGFLAFNNFPCTEWVKILGMCNTDTNTELHGVNQFYAVFEKNHAPRWWLNKGDNNFTTNCHEWSSPHGIGIPLTSRTTPTRDLNSYNDSFEGSCQTPNLPPRGFHDKNDAATCSVHGWAVDATNADVKLPVNIYSDGVLVKTISADQQRNDLKREGVCPQGACGFTANLTGVLSPGVTHQITVKTSDTSTGEEYTLSNSPLPLTCTKPVDTPPSCSLSFTPASGPSGTNVTYTWSSKDDADGTLAYNCTDGFSASLPPSGKRTFNPQESVTCTLITQNSAGQKTCSASFVREPENPPEPCATLSPTKEIPQGYGASYDVFSPKKELLIRTTCQSSSVAVRLGDAHDHYFYNKGYVWNAAQQQWKQITFSGSQKTGNWLRASASASLSPAPVGPDGLGYLLVYSCTLVDTTWKCGCRDQQCSTPYWQLQEFKP